jgi:hypothetical protein
MEKSISKWLTDLQPLPKYQLERRIDIFILNELTDVFSKLLKEKTYFIYPEFPLRGLKELDGKIKFDSGISEIYKKREHVESKHNTNVDYLLASKDTYYFVELKTDTNSFKETSQLLYYLYYVEQPFETLYKFFRDQLAGSKKQDPKWKKGLSFLKRNFYWHFESEIQDNLKKDLKIIYLGPSAIKGTNEYKVMEDILKEKLKFFSLAEFAEEIKGDEILKELLIEIDKEKKE